MRWQIDLGDHADAAQPRVLHHAPDVRAGICAHARSSCMVGAALCVSEIRCRAADWSSKAEPRGNSNWSLLSFPCSHSLGHISAISFPFFPVFCAFSPSRRGGPNEPQAGTQGQETAARGPRPEISALRSTPQMLTKGSTGRPWAVEARRREIEESGRQHMVGLDGAKRRVPQARLSAYQLDLAGVLE